MSISRVADCGVWIRNAFGLFLMRMHLEAKPHADCIFQQPLERFPHNLSIKPTKEELSHEQKDFSQNRYHFQKNCIAVIHTGEEFPALPA
jgi:hypothetical protein